MLHCRPINDLNLETGVPEGVLHEWKIQILNGNGGPDKKSLEIRKRIFELESVVKNLKKAVLLFSKSQ